MAKIHTRLKRKRGLRSSRHGHKLSFSRVEKASGPRSFSTKEEAEAWAKTAKVPKEYVLHHTGRKFQWRPAPRG